MTSEQSDDGYDLPIDPLLGQPRMVSDPRISVAQAAQLLGKTTAQVYRMIRLGRLHRQGEAHKSWGLLLSDVLRCRDRVDPIKVKEAAAVLGGTGEDVRRLIATGRLALVPGSQRLVYEAMFDSSPARVRHLGTAHVPWRAPLGTARRMWPSAESRARLGGRVTRISCLRLVSPAALARGSSPTRARSRPPAPSQAQHR